MQYLEAKDWEAGRQLRRRDLDVCARRHWRRPAAAADSILRLLMWWL